MYKSYQDKLNKAYDEYITTIESLAEEARNKILIPYLKKHNLRFLVGNGTYIIFNPLKPLYDHTWELDNLPKRIQAILTLEIEDNHNPELGLWMRDYIGKE